MTGTSKPARADHSAEPTAAPDGDAETMHDTGSPQVDPDGDAPTVPGIPLDALRIDPEPTQRIRPVRPDTEDSDEALEDSGAEDDAADVDTEAETIPPTTTPLYAPPHHGDRALPTDTTVHVRPRDPLEQTNDDD